MYKAVIFDLDGTLVDSPLCFKSIRHELGIPEDQYILEFLDGLPAAERHAKKLRLEEIEYQAATKAVPFPGVTRLLNELSDRKMHVGVFTRNCRVATDHVIRTHEFRVDMAITREDAPPKPNPEGLERFLSRWQVARSELLFVGDFRFDIECGKKAGVRTALFTNGQDPDEDLSPDHVIPDFSSFWKCL